MPFTIIGSQLAMNQFNSRLHLFIGGLLLVGGMFASTFVQSYPAFVVLFPSLFGVASGLTYVIPMNVAWQYFPGREGLVTGLIDTSYGLGSALFGNVLNQFINPDNVEI